jgi:hypothetical protein
VVRPEEGYFAAASRRRPEPEPEAGQEREQERAQAQEEQALLPNTIQPTPSQAQATDQVLAALALDPDEDEDQLQLQHAVRNLSLALICQKVGSTPFQSAVISFCAMLSRTAPGKRQEAEAEPGQGAWQEPGNFNHYLSALTWTAQLVIFDYACFYEQADEDQIPAFLAKICKLFFQQLAETPFGYILQWRLYLFAVSKQTLARHQAVWSLDGQTVLYRGVDLQMAQVSRLALSEYQQAHALLYDELMFGAGDLPLLESWRLQDDLDLQRFGGSWLQHAPNAELLAGADLALLRQIQGRADLRGLFLRRAATGSRSGSGSGSQPAALDATAIDVYEAHAQDFLRRLLVLCHVTSGQPLRQPELLSVRWQNTDRQRHVLLWEKLVLIHTQYHKGQQQTGAYKENVRFLPKAVGHLLLDYLAYVIPLRQLFLRQRKRQALISPYLWSKLDGTVWPDSTLSSCLVKACARAKVPRLHTSSWRHFSAAICKEKFSKIEQANFDLDGGQAEEELGEEELDLAAMAEQSNHSFRTFNLAYAGATALTTNALLHRGHRASLAWQQFFRFDQTLLGKRPRAPSDAAAAAGQAAAAPPATLASRVRKGQFHPRGAYLEAELLATARRLYNDPALQFRGTGQREAVLAVLGPRPAEQVMLVAGTGAGKTLVAMLSATVADARTTLFILPMVALRGDMLRRCREAGIRPLVWSVGSREAAPLVLIAAESACTEQFLDYAKGLALRQQLDRIIVDECHLTITASDYRPCMSLLGWHLRQVLAQTVWLTATLPPAMQEQFVEHNKLVRPRVVRESTNRPNIRYLVSLETGPGTLLEKAAALVRACWPKQGIFDQSRDKVIIYCRTRVEAGQLGEILQCPVYTSASGTAEEKAVLLAGWLQARDQPAIAATSALGLGFDYPYVRWVIHAGAPDKATSFAQESGRAGRGGDWATSIVLLSATWQPRLDPGLSPDEAAMQLYLTQRHCSRGVLSQFLDSEPHWRWCMAGEAACQVCGEPHAEPRPPGLRLTGAAEEAAAATAATGPAEVLRQDQAQDQALDAYERDLELMLGSCLHCRVLGRRFDHAPQACSRRFRWIHAKKEALGTQQRAGKPWIQPYVACWKCYQPQDVCRAADPEHPEAGCRFPDMVMPLCYGVYQRPGAADWLRQRFQRSFPSELEYMLWLGTTASLAGTECIQATCVAAAALREM